MGASVYKWHVVVVFLESKYNRNVHSIGPPWPWLLILLRHLRAQETANTQASSSSSNERPGNRAINRRAYGSIRTDLGASRGQWWLAVAGAVARLRRIFAVNVYVLAPSYRFYHFLFDSSPARTSGQVARAWGIWECCRASIWGSPASSSSLLVGVVVPSASRLNWQAAMCSLFRITSGL